MKPNTVHQWMQRGLLPAPRYLIADDRLVWDWNVDIVPWLLASPRRAHLCCPERSFCLSS